MITTLKENNINKLLLTIVDELGYQEHQTKESLDEKYKNVGTGNYTKYAEELDNIPEFYSGKKNGYAWCDSFVDWCFVKTFGAESAQRMMYQPKNKHGATCQNSAQWYKDNNAFTTYPEVGSQIFFYRGEDKKEIGHTGIVLSCTNEHVFTVEGNTRSDLSVHFGSGGNVTLKYYNINDTDIAGYGIPDFEYEPINDVTVTLPYLRKGDKSEAVMSAQVLLNKFGYGLETDGSFGGKTQTAVKDFQENYCKEVTGNIDADTWRELLI